MTSSSGGLDEPLLPHTTSRGEDGGIVAEASPTDFLVDDDDASASTTTGICSGLDSGDTRILAILLILSLCAPLHWYLSRMVTFATVQYSYQEFTVYHNHTSNSNSSNSNHSQTTTTTTIDSYRRSVTVPCQHGLLIFHVAAIVPTNSSDYPQHDPLHPMLSFQRDGDVRVLFGNDGAPCWAAPSWTILEEQQQTNTTTSTNHSSSSSSTPSSGTTNNDWTQNSTATTTMPWFSPGWDDRQDHRVPLDGTCQQISIVEQTDELESDEDYDPLHIPPYDRFSGHYAMVLTQGDVLYELFHSKNDDKALQWLDDTVRAWNVTEGQDSMGAHCRGPYLFSDD